MSHNLTDSEKVEQSLAELEQAIQLFKQVGEIKMRRDQGMDFQLALGHLITAKARLLGVPKEDLIKFDKL